MQGIGEIKEAKERSLTGTWDIADLQRWRWTVEKGQNTGINNVIPQSPEYSSDSVD